MKKIVYFILLLIPIFIIAQNSKYNNVSEINNADYLIIPFNRIMLPIFENGAIGQTESGRFSGGYIDSFKFLSSAGFLLSGINDKGIKWVNSVLPNIGVYDYLPGKINSDQNEKTLFYVIDESFPFHSSWQDWKYAVELGAHYYDGNNDGMYNPIDFNENGIWDTNEDRPETYGNIMSWSVFNDGVKPEERKTENAEPQGIEIEQTIFSFNQNPQLETTYFIKYKITNVGNISSSHDSVYFSVFADPDLMNYRNDYFGSDTISNSAFIYYPFSKYYSNTEEITFLANLLNGPAVESENYEDIAVQLVGEDLQNNVLQGYKNLKLASISEAPTRSILQDAVKARKYIVNSINPDPCFDYRGIVYNEDCNDIIKRFLYSGDPIKETGWVNIQSSDKDLIMSTGPFKLEANKPVEIIYAFVVGTASNGIDALSNAKNIQKEIQKSFYEPPKDLPRVNPTIITDEKSIELIWETADFFGFNSKGYDYDLDFEGFNVYMYNSLSTSDQINGINNKIKIASYDVSNEITQLYVEDEFESDTDLLYEGGEQLSNQIYSNNETGRIILKIDRDPFELTSLTTGRPYFISITPFAINRRSLTKLDSKGKYLIPNNSNYGYIELDPLIINDNKGNPGIVLGENENEPYFKGISAEHISGNSEVVITYSVYDRSVITDDLYEIGFTRKETELYGLNYYVKNLTKNVYLIENIDFENYQSNIQNLKEGFLVNLNWQEPGINEVTFEGNSQWFNEFNNLETGVFYLGIDVLQREKITPVNPLKFSTAISVDKMADVELRFGETGKAYRYIREAVRYFWAGNENPELGFVDIPVTAHKLYSNGETEQLSIGFLENAFPFDSLAHPDLKWNPGSNIGQSKEYLVIFNSKYSENYEAHQAYYGTKENPALVSLGYNLESDKDSLNLIARSPWFDALYVVGFELPEYYDDFVPSGKLIIDAKQVLSENDKYVFKIKKEKTEVEEKEQFEKINVFPNPLFAYNSAGSYFGNNPDEPFVTFSHLPKTATLKIYTLSGNLIRELQKNNLSSAVQWDLQNEYGRRVGSGFYLAIIESPGIGQKVLKFSIIMPQKNVHF